MNKYTIIGDLHCREVWKQIVEKESDSDKFIFLGDYLPPRDFEYDDPTDAEGFLYEVLDFKDQNSDKVILLRGNHCTQMLGYYWAECWPKVHPGVAAYCQTNDVKNWFLNNTQWVYHIPYTNIICSHAGISTVFLKNVEKYLVSHKGSQYDDGTIDGEIVIDLINTIEPCELFGFTDDNPYDTNGESKCQPCTWIRPYTLIDYSPEGLIQVVGHTPVTKGIFHLDNKENNSSIWCCDALGLENPQYLVIENGEFKICKIHDNHT